MCYLKVCSKLVFLYIKISLKEVTLGCKKVDDPFFKKFVFKLVLAMTLAFLSFGGSEQNLLQSTLNSKSDPYTLIHFVMDL